MTEFKESVMGAFDLSPDGKQLARLRGVLIRNAVLIGEARQ